MKFAISVPDVVFAAVETAAGRQGVSRSEFYATAARRYLDELQRASVTAAANEAVGLGGGQDPSASDWTMEAARRTFEREPW